MGIDESKFSQYHPQSDLTNQFVIYCFLVFSCLYNAIYESILANFTSVDDSICGCVITISIFGDGFWLSSEIYLLLMSILLFSFPLAINSELLYIQSDIMGYELMVRLLMCLFNTHTLNLVLTWKFNLKNKTC